VRQSRNSHSVVARPYDPANCSDNRGDNTLSILLVAVHLPEVSLICQVRLPPRVISSNTTTKDRQGGRLQVPRQELRSTCPRPWHPQARPQGKTRNLSRLPVHPMSHTVLSLLSTVVKVCLGHLWCLEGGRAADHCADE
jgi:hypothetical protein